MPRGGLALLLGGLFAASGCAIVYELLIGSISSYFLGDTVEQFSLTIGFFLFAMGVGSYFSQLLKGQLLARFIAVELALGLIGGLAVAGLYMAYSHSGHYRYWMLVLILVIGGLIGLEIPLITRILRGYGTLRQTLANVLSLDYLGALGAALLFPYLLMPLLGSLLTGLVAGLVNIGVGIGVLWAFRNQLTSGARRLLWAFAGVSTMVLGAVLVGSQPLLERWESALYADRIIHSEQSTYQRIVLTQWRDDYRLYLDGHLQFAAVDEYRYHEALVHPAMVQTRHPQRVLIIGGGDGLSAREVLKYPEVEQVDLVDLDPAVTLLGQRHLALTGLNQNALNNPKVRVLNRDAFLFLQQAHQAYGAIIIDLPDPREETLAKLYSVEGYKLCLRLLSPGGVLVTQATSPYYARRAYWSIGATLQAAGLAVVSYHTPVPSFGEWGFHLASLEPLDWTNLSFTVPRRFINEPLFRTMLVFDADMAPLPVQENRLDQPLLARYYRDGWSRW
ncbi:MAG: polyamine aminopropyltransferase [Candidatus Latescibacteria bacterium]|nr:polyamine aminopropyltransferase [Candidatus Latescibacterota bacterium]